MSYEFTLQQIENAANASELEMETNVRIAYSGRGMYGKECLGIVAELGDIMLFLFELLDGEGAYTDSKSLVAELLNSAARDSMGMSTIWYWSNITVDTESEHE